MDLVTKAIVAAVSAGITQVGKTAVVDAYTALKMLILKRFGENNELSVAVEGLEKRPDSESRKAVIAEEVETHGAGKDSEILEAAQILLNLLKQDTHAEQHIMNAKGKYIAQAIRGVAKVNVSRK